MSKYYKDFNLTESQLMKAKMWFIAQDLIKELEFNDVLDTFVTLYDDKKLYIDYVDTKVFLITNILADDSLNEEGTLSLGYNDVTGTITIYELNIKDEESKALCIEEIKKSASKIFTDIKFKGEWCLC